MVTDGYVGHWLEAASAALPSSRSCLATVTRYVAPQPRWSFADAHKQYHKSAAPSS